MQAIAWVTGDRYTGREYINGAKGRRLRACAATKVEDLIWGADYKGDRAKKKQDRELESCWKVAAGRSHTCKGSTCNNDHIQHGHMADALQSAHGSFGAWTRGKDDAQGTRQWRRRRRAWPEVTTGRIKPSGKIRVACSKEDCFVCLCANIYIYIYSGYTGAWVFVLRVIYTTDRRCL